jgi:hypothetical protein
LGEKLSTLVMLGDTPYEHLLRKATPRKAKLAGVAVVCRCTSIGYRMPICLGFRSIWTPRAAPSLRRNSE